jgi:ribonuclease Y
MEIVLAALVAAAVAVAVVLLVHRPRAASPTAGGSGSQSPLTAAAAPSAPPAAPAAPRRSTAEPQSAPERRDALEDELRARRGELARMEERMLGKEQSLDLRAQELEERERSLDDRGRNLDLNQDQLKEAKRAQLRELEQVAGLSAGQARQILLRELEDELRHDSARVIRQAEEQAKREADRRARNILAAVMQRVAGGHAVETTVSVVELKSDEL